MKKFFAGRAASTGGSLVKRRLTFVLAVASLAVVGAAVAPSASAGTVSVDEGYVLNYAAPDGEANVVTILETPQDVGPPTWTVRETGAPLVVGPGCTRVDPNTATCEMAEECISIEASLGDLDDSARVGGRCADISIDGGAGEDYLRAGDAEGNANIQGGAGADVLEGAGPLRGGPGNDLLRACSCEDAAFENVYLYGDAGSDTITLRGVKALEIDLRGGDGDDTLFGPRGGADRGAIAGGAGNDSIIGADGPDRVFGGGGHDTIRGRGGSDLLNGSTGRDELDGGAGRDSFYARDGQRDRLDGGPGTDRARVDGLDLRKSIERLF